MGVQIGLPVWIGVGIGLIAVVVWIVFSVAIWKDASRLEREGYQLRFVGSLWWFLLTLFFHFPAALLYWAAHRSSLSGILDERPTSPMNAAPEPQAKTSGMVEGNGVTGTKSQGNRKTGDPGCCKRSFDTNAIIAGCAGDSGHRMQSCLPSSAANSHRSFPFHWPWNTRRLPNVPGMLPHLSIGQIDAILNLICARAIEQRIYFQLASLPTRPG